MMYPEDMEVSFWVVQRFFLMSVKAHEVFPTNHNQLNYQSSFFISPIFKTAHLMTLKNGEGCVLNFYLPYSLH